MIDDAAALRPGEEWIVQVGDGETSVFTLRISAEGSS